MAKIFLSSLFLIGCAEYPKVTLTILDNKKNLAYPYKITKYNRETCELELETKPTISLFDPGLNGAVCVSVDDYKKLQAKAKADCINQRDN